MKRAVWIDGTRVALEPAALLGQGGEAEVYDLGDGRVVKWWKPADHPDFDGLPDQQAAAARRIATAPARLRALPGGLPAAVVAPVGLALGTRGGAVAGYLMPKIAGTALHAYGEPRWRRDHPVAGADVVAALLALHDALAGLHRAGLVVGDCNDLNILVDGTRVHLIDVDSYQLPGFACEMFSERFLDPRLCDAPGLPARPHDAASDWFAFAAMVLRSLLGVGPWGGVHQPADPARRCPPTARAHRRLSVFANDIVYPRAARPLAILAPALAVALRDIFEQDQRGEFPRAVLDRFHLRACRRCGDEHGAAACPACQTAVFVPPTVVRGGLRTTAIEASAVALATRVIGPAGDADVWLAGDALMRRGRLGPERVGTVLAGQTRAWVGPTLGVGYYRAGGFTAGFVFRPDRGLLDDRVALPRIRGQIVDAHGIVGGDRAWLAFTLADAGRLTTLLVCIGADATIIAAETLADAPWVSGVPGACAAGPHLFVPTDAGVARIELVHGAFVQTRVFAETALVVGAGDLLALGPGGLDRIDSRGRALRLALS